MVIEVSAIIPAQRALQETIRVLDRDEIFNATSENVRKALEQSIDLNVGGIARTCLRTACAVSNLKMMVSDPKDPGRRFTIPMSFFDTPNADVVFDQVTFSGCEPVGQVTGDAVDILVRSFIGMVHGFDEPHFRAWLEDAAVGPLTGPRLLPSFAHSPDPLLQNFQEPAPVVAAVAADGSPPVGLETAVLEALNSGLKPGRGGMRWTLFNDHIWDRCGKAATDGGFGSKSIERMVTNVRARPVAGSAGGQN
jgi:uncharacterized protein (UPF0147 family)